MASIGGIKVQGKDSNKKLGLRFGSLDIPSFNIFELKEILKQAVKVRVIFSFFFFFFISCLFHVFQEGTILCLS